MSIDREKYLRIDKVTTPEGFEYEVGWYESNGNYHAEILLPGVDFDTTVILCGEEYRGTYGNAIKSLRLRELEVAQSLRAIGCDAWADELLAGEK